jgi:hypothetical protein
LSAFKKPEAPRLPAPMRPVVVASRPIPAPTATTVAEEPLLPSNRKLADLSCPECASPDVRKVSLIFESGTKASRSVAVGMTGDNEAGVAVIGGQQQSLLASRLQPPKLAGDGGRAFLAALATFGFFFVLCVAAGGHPSLLLLAGLVPIPIWWWVHNLYAPAARQAYEAALAQWQKQWCCMKCGNVFA